MNLNTNEILHANDAALHKKRVVNNSTDGGLITRKHHLGYSPRMIDRLFKLETILLIVLSLFLIGCAWKEVAKPNTQTCQLCNK